MASAASVQRHEVERLAYLVHRYTHLLQTTDLRAADRLMLLRAVYSLYDSAAQWGAQAEADVLVGTIPLPVGQPGCPRGR